MTLKLPVRFGGIKVEKILFTLFDRGATFGSIYPVHAVEIAEPQKMLTPLEAATASQGTYLEISERITPDIYIDDIRMSEEFMVVPNLSEDAIIGVTTLQKWRNKLDFEHDTVIIDPKIAKAIFIGT